MVRTVLGVPARATDRASWAAHRTLTALARWMLVRGVLVRGVLARLPLRGERGDVPGWVMVTVMTAGLVAAVFAVFRDAIVTAVQTALAQVVSGTEG